MKLQATILTGFILFFIAFAPMPVFAQGTSGSRTPDVSGSQRTPDVSGVTTNLDIKINNPLKVKTIQEAIKLFVGALVRIAIPIIVIFFIWSGISFIFARGNPEKIKQAKQMFFYTVIGTLLILGAWTITNAIIGTVNSIVTG